jgi:hypothetical protein
VAFRSISSMPLKLARAPLTSSVRPAAK